MCKVAPFSREQVKAFRFTIDFCYWRGIPIARKWPEWKYPAASDKQLEFQNAMRISRQILDEIDPALKMFWHNVFQGKKPSWIDRFTSQYLSAYSLLAPDWPPFLKSIQFDHQSPDLQVSFETSAEGEYYVAALPKANVQETHWKRQKGTYVDDCKDRYPQPVAQVTAIADPWRPPIYPNLVAVDQQWRWGLADAPTMQTAIAAAWDMMLAMDFFPVSFIWPQLVSGCSGPGAFRRAYVFESRQQHVWDFTGYPPELVDQVTHVGIAYNQGNVRNEIFGNISPPHLELSGDVEGGVSLYPYQSPALVPVSGHLPYPEVHLNIDSSPGVYGFQYKTPDLAHGWDLPYALVGEFRRGKIYRATFFQTEVTDELDDLFYLVYEGTHRIPIALPIPYNTETHI